MCNVTESQLIQLIIAFCLLESPNDLASMARLVTGLSHSLVSECSLFLLVVPAAHPFCHWTVAFPRALLWICYYTCFLLTHWWHKTIGITTFLFTFMLTILCFTYHLSRLFWVTFPWPGHTPRWNPVLMIPINVCYTLMMVRQRCWLSMLRTISSLINFKWPLNCYLLASAKNIGVGLNSMLSLDNHIIQICKSSSLHQIINSI